MQHELSVRKSQNSTPHTRSLKTERCTTCQWALGSLPIRPILSPTTARRSTCLQLFEKWRLSYLIPKICTYMHETLDSDVTHIMYMYIM